MELFPSIDLPDEAATAALAQRLGPFLRPGDLVALRGDLGAGKTAFARALIRALTCDPDREVPSPTFTLIQSYETARGNLYHLDLYRIGSPDELDEIGWDEALVDGIVLVEWPDRAGNLLPADRLDLTLEFAGADETRRALLCPSAGWADKHPGFTALQGGPRGRIVAPPSGFGSTQ